MSASLSEVVAEFRGSPAAQSLRPEVVHAAEQSGGSHPDRHRVLGRDDGQRQQRAVADGRHLIEQGNITELEHLLDENRSSVLSVDLKDLPLWGETAAPEGSPGDAADHAVVITGIDTDKGLVYLNDPGHPEGREETLTIDQLEQAWNDGNHTMIVTDSAHPDAGTPSGSPLDPPAGSLYGSGGSVLLPVTVPGFLLADPFAF